MKISLSILFIFCSLVGFSQKISDLPAASTPLSGAELLAAVQSATTKKVTAQDIANLVTSTSIGAVPTSRTINSQALSSDITLTKSNIGLSNVDNTSDATKPVSTAQQTALDLKANLAGTQTFTGVHNFTTAATGTNTTQAATTAFVQQELTTSIVSITGATTLDATAFGKLHIFTGTSADYTVGLPTAVGNTGKSIPIKGSSALTKIVTFDGNASETVDGRLIKELAGSGYFLLISDGTNWFITGEIPSVITYVPTYVGWASDPIGYGATYTIVGKLCTMRVYTNQVTSNTTTATVSMPSGVSAANGAAFPIRSSNNGGAWVAGIALIATNDTVVTCYATIAGGAWTAGGLKGVMFNVTFAIN